MSSYYRYEQEGGGVHFLDVSWSTYDFGSEVGGGVVLPAGMAAQVEFTEAFLSLGASSTSTLWFWAAANLSLATSARHVWLEMPRANLSLATSVHHIDAPAGSPAPGSSARYFDVPAGDFAH